MKTKSRFITNNEIDQVVDYMKTTLEVSPLSHTQKCELATELCVELYGFTPSKSLQLLITKKANYWWHAVKVSTLSEMRQS